MGDTEFPRLRKPKRVVGHRLQFRDATPEDAGFILSLRLDDNKNTYLSKTQPDVAAQRRWLEDYRLDEDQVYFIIETVEGASVGTVRLYDVRGALFSWGSWILSNEAPKSSAVESTLMVYHFGLELGFQGAHFEVRRGNERVWQYHERFGATRVGEDELNYYYEIDSAAIEAAIQRYSSRLPNGVRIEL